EVVVEVVGIEVVNGAVGGGEFLESSEGVVLVDEGDAVWFLDGVESAEVIGVLGGFGVLFGFGEFLPHGVVGGFDGVGADIGVVMEDVLFMLGFVAAAVVVKGGVGVEVTVGVVDFVFFELVYWVVDF